MKNMNFRTLEELKAPSELKEKVLSIPDSDSSKPSGFRLSSRIIAAAAVLVVIAAVSIALFLRTGNNSELEIKPSIPDPTVPYTEYIGDTQDTDAADTPSQKHYEDHTADPTEKSTDAVRRMTESIINPTSQSGTAAAGTTNTSETKSPTQSAAQRSTQPAAAPSQQGTIRPTQSPTYKPTQAPTAVSTVDPTEAPTQEPTIAPVFVPTIPEIELPSDAPKYTYNFMIRRGQKKLITGNIYCMICDSDDNMIGDQNIFSDEHIADFTEDKQGKYTYYHVSYCPVDRGVYLEPGNYHYYFYTDDYYETGKMLFSSTWMYIE